MMQRAFQTSGQFNRIVVVTGSHRWASTTASQFQTMSRLPTHRSRHSLSSASMQAASTGAPATYGGMVPASAGSYGLLGRPMPQEGMELREGAYMNPHEEDVGRLGRLDWAQALLAEPDMHVVLQCAAMNPDPGVDPDHLFLGLLQQDIIRDVAFLFNPAAGTFHALIALGPDVCGHPCTVHGGFTSAVVDEATGGLVFSLKKSGKLGPGPAFTVRLEVDYRKPIPSDSDIICTARVESMEGRKAWISAEVMDRPGGVVYASGRALYVTPKQYFEEGSNGS